MERNLPPRLWPRSWRRPSRVAMCLTVASAAMLSFLPVGPVDLAKKKSSRKPHHAKAKTHKPPQVKEGFVQEGMASWYGQRFHGKKTASGERFNMYDLTAAHRTLPFGTYVLVTNLSNRKQVVVRINDRGPWAEGRIIDLSYAAAKEIGMIEKGKVKVRIEVVKKTGALPNFSSPPDDEKPFPPRVKKDNPLD